MGPRENGKGPTGIRRRRGRLFRNTRRARAYPKALERGGLSAPRRASRRERACRNPRHRRRQDRFRCFGCGARGALHDVSQRNTELGPTLSGWRRPTSSGSCERRARLLRRQTEQAPQSSFERGKCAEPFVSRVRARWWEESAEIRRARRKWVPHATEARQSGLFARTDCFAARIANLVADDWELPEVDYPGVSRGFPGSFRN